MQGAGAVTALTRWLDSDTHAAWTLLVAPMVGSALVYAGGFLLAWRKGWLR